MSDVTVVKLMGFKAPKKMARVGAEVKFFSDHADLTKAKVTVAIAAGKEARLKTLTGTYTLGYNMGANIYQGVANGHKVHVTVHKVSGKMIYY